MKREIKKIFYPLEEAIQKAAEQNWQRDSLWEGAGLIGDKEEEFPIYIEEARIVLTDTGENFMPEHPHTEHICVLK